MVAVTFNVSVSVSVYVSQYESTGVADAESEPTIAGDMYLLWLFFDMHALAHDRYRMRKSKIFEGTTLPMKKTRYAF